MGVRKPQRCWSEGTVGVRKGVGARGRWAVPAHSWSPSMLRRREPRGPYIFSKLAAYPGRMNELLARAMFKAILASKLPTAKEVLSERRGVSFVKQGRFENSIVRKDLIGRHFPEILVRLPSGPLALLRQ